MAGTISADDTIPEGRRNVELTSCAGYWRCEGKDCEQILKLLELENERRCRPPLPNRELEAIAQSIGSKPTTIENPEITNEDDQVDSTGAPNLPEIAWRGVFEKYREALEGVTEASDAFHFASLWARIATALGRRVAFDYGMTLYPNVYIVCFGPTADRKTTATRKARELPLRFPLIVGGGSGEGLAEEFSKIMIPGEGMMLYVEEFSQLLRAGKWSGATLLPFLTQCFDCPVLYQLKFRKAPVEIKQPTPTLLSCTTADWFWRDFDARDFAGGYGNRLAFFLGPRKAAIPLPRTPVLETIADSLAITTAAPRCVARLSSNGRASWEKFYRSWDASRSKRDPQLAAATERIPSYVLKLAMVYAAIEATLPEITSDQLASAIAVGDYLMVGAEHVLSLQHAATNPRRELERRILAHLAKYRTTTKRAITKALWRHYKSTEEFNRAFDSLARAGQIFTCAGLHGRVDVSTDLLI